MFSLQPPLKRDRPLVKVKRVPKGKASDAWDFVYKKQKEDAMIARRRSTSSFSSSASHHRLSLDAPVKLKGIGHINLTNKIPLKLVPKVVSQIISEPQVNLLKLSSQTLNSKQFEFAKPENKAQKLKKPKVPHVTDPLSDDIKKAAANRNVRSPEESEERNQISTREAQEQTQKSSSTSDHADVIVNKIGKVAQIVLNTHKAKIPNTFSAQVKL